MLLLSRPAKRGLASVRRSQPRLPARGRDHGSRRAAHLAHPEHRLTIACPSPTEEDTTRDRHQARGQFLARQERWEDLLTEIRTAETERQSTPAAMPVADLLSYGARADVVLAVEHALFDGPPAPDAPLLSGIEALEAVLAETGHDMHLSAIVAQTHVDIAWAWRGTVPDRELPARNRTAATAHFDRTRDLLRPFDAPHHALPTLALARCALHGAGGSSLDQIADDYARLIDLDPHTPGPMRALGTRLSPRRAGSPARLELEARRTAARTQDVWGAGAYAWVMFDVLCSDDDTCAQLDVQFFVDGLHDILTRSPHQYTVNLLAAYCANIIGGTRTGHDAADQTRALIADCADWIVRTHMTELHPLIWAHAATGFDNTLRVRSARGFAAAGRADALRTLAGLFRREIAQGHHIIFTDDGPLAEAV
ncbi:hypothetical protein [uncultured Roseobacter sp.]|uniref:hypothetical protein n=1 Tax=uncultured Roseobacter sp. TaxID=114847 RepID=UPI002636231E|nr:hypothetical protein [uncultured Roseobacter sp.]